jgi:hypothetical protein
MAIQVDIQERKLDLIQWLSTVDDPLVIDRIEGLKTEETTEYWTEISEAENASIVKGLKDADAGKLVPHSEARKLYEKWL